MVGRAPLNGKADDLFRLGVCLVFRLLFDVPHLQRGIVPGFVEYVFGQKLFRLFLCKLGDLFKLLNHQIVLMIDLFLHFFDLAFLTGKIFLLLFERV